MKSNKINVLRKCPFLGWISLFTKWRGVLQSKLKRMLPLRGAWLALAGRGAWPSVSGACRVAGVRPVGQLADVPQRHASELRSALRRPRTQCRAVRTGTSKLGAIRLPAVVDLQGLRTAGQASRTRGESLSAPLAFPHCFFRRAPNGLAPLAGSARAVNCRKKRKMPI